MMTRTIFFLLATAVIRTIGAQSIDREVVATQGDQQEAGALILSWTLGETLAGPLRQNGVILHQGFQQGAIRMEPTAVEDLRRRFQIRLYPNPTASVIYLDREAPVTPNDWHIQVFSAEGRRVDAARIWPSGMSTVSLQLSELPAGPYFLQLRGEATEKSVVIPFQKGSPR